MGCAHIKYAGIELYLAVDYFLGNCAPTGLAPVAHSNFGFNE